MRKNIFLTITILGLVIGVTAMTYMVSVNKKVSSEERMVDCIKDECFNDEEE